MNVADLPISLSEDSIQEFCQRHHIGWLALFGSILRDDFRPESDLDVLVEFEPDYVPGLMGLLQMQDEFARLTGRTVDLLTPRFLHRQIRQQVLDQARGIYDAAQRQFVPAAVSLALSFILPPPTAASTLPTGSP